MKSLLVALSTLLVAACATTTEPVRAPVNIEIQEQVGFTIIEEARIGGEVRVETESMVHEHYLATTCTRASISRCW